MSTDVRPLQLEVGHDHVAVITLTRPELLNRFDAALHGAFTDALVALRENRRIRAVALLSTGKVFSAGGDFAWIREMHEHLDARMAALDDLRRLVVGLLELPAPLVVGLHGNAYGVGATVAMAADAVVAARSCSLADTHVNIGLAAGDGGAIFWPLALGPLKAKRHLLTGDPIDAEEAHRLGIVTDLVDDPADVAGATLALARRIAALAPLAVQATRRIVNRGVLLRAGELIDAGAAEEGLTVGSADLIEAIDAFEGRRPAVYEGR